MTSQRTLIRRFAMERGDLIYRHTDLKSAHKHGKTEFGELKFQETCQSIAPDLSNPQHSPFISEIPYVLHFFS